MQKKYSLRLLLVVIAFLGSRMFSFAQADQIERLWYNEEKTAKIQIYKAKDGNFYGKITWLSEPNRDGKPKTDIKNPDEARHNDPVIGLLILKKFKKDGDKGYEGGTVYDPKNGKTYKCKITYQGDKLDVRGFVGFSLLGRTATWTKAD